jgi:hypothetical protein
MWGLVRPEPKKPKVCFGSIASVWPIAGYFRSSPNNGHGEAGPLSPKSAKSGLMHRSKQHPIRSPSRR